MGKLNFEAPNADFVPEEFVAPSEVEGVTPIVRTGGCDCETCRARAQERIDRYNQNAAEVRRVWRENRRRKARELGIEV